MSVKYIKFEFKELFIRFTASAFRKLPSTYVFSYFPFAFEDRIWDLIVSVPDYCLSFYFTRIYGRTIVLFGNLSRYRENPYSRYGFID